jgi:hypothetical protein
MAVFRSNGETRTEVCARHGKERQIVWQTLSFSHLNEHWPPIKHNFFQKKIPRKSLFSLGAVSLFELSRQTTLLLTFVESIFIVGHAHVP